MNDDLRLDPRADEAPDALEEGRLSRAFVSDVAAALDSGDDDGVRALVRPLHPADVARLMTQLHALVEVGNTVIVVEHDMHVLAGSDFVIDVGPGAGDAGGRGVAMGPPRDVARAMEGRTATYLRRYLERGE